MGKIDKVFILIGFLFVVLSSCSKKVQKEIEVYSNDFESGILDGINNGFIDSFNHTMVLGRYNSGGFDLQVSGLPQHDLVEITFDLFIHDSWDGNKVGIDNVDGPDIWQMKIDGDLYINTTFSNSICSNTTFCPPQSYPGNYLNSNNNPRKGAAKINLPGACNPMGTSTLYKIKKIIRHSDSKISLQCSDELMQINTMDFKCDESWSIDNIKMNVIALE